MRAHIIGIVVIAAAVATAAAASNSTDGREGGGRLFSIFQVVKFPNEACDAGSSSRNGTCYTSAECTSLGGASSGTCASGYGVCCIFQMGCGTSSSQNNTYLVETAVTSTSPSPCVYEICRASSSVCRIRFDFKLFDIEGPNTEPVALTTTAVLSGSDVGDCTMDTFSVTAPGNVGSPVICGYNTGQHMIMDASALCHKATFALGSTSTQRSWDILVTQYDCGDTLAGPSNCLQYFVGASGTVASYNFPTTATALGPTVTHLSDQKYTICFRREAGYCAICYTPSIQQGAIAASPIDGQDSFGLSVATTAAIDAATDSNCAADYLYVGSLSLACRQQGLHFNRKISNRSIRLISQTMVKG